MASVWGFINPVLTRHFDEVHYGKICAEVLVETLIAAGVRQVCGAVGLHPIAKEGRSR